MNLSWIEIEIIHLEVVKAFQNLGIGTKLIKNLEKKYENIEKNVQVFLETNKNNKIAINLYEKMGYKTYNERKNYYMQGKIDNIHSNTALLFTKKLKSI